MPLVSFVMPNQNKAVYLNDSIRTLLNQTLSDIELVIVDDGSTDDSRDIINTWARRDHRIVKKYLAPVNLPVGNRIDRARNIGNGLAKSKYICVCDSDDWYTPYRAELSYKTLERRKNCGLFHTAFLLRDKYGNHKKGLIPVDGLLRFSKKRLWQTGKFYIGHPTICYHRDIILKHPYDTAGGVGDWGMLYDLLINVGVKTCHSNKPVHIYRVYANTERHIDMRTKKDYSFDNYLLDKKRKKMDKEKVLR